MDAPPDQGRGEVERHKWLPGLEKRGREGGDTRLSGVPPHTVGADLLPAARGSLPQRLFMERLAILFVIIHNKFNSKSLGINEIHCESFVQIH